MVFASRRIACSSSRNASTVAPDVVMRRVINAASQISKVLNRCLHDRQSRRRLIDDMPSQNTGRESLTRVSGAPQCAQLKLPPLSRTDLITIAPRP
jgi:hypothetical protein